MLRLSNLHGLRQRLNNRLQIYRSFFKYSKQISIKYHGNLKKISVKNNISVKLSSGTVYFSILLFCGEQKRFRELQLRRHRELLYGYK